MDFDKLSVRNFQGLGKNLFSSLCCVISFAIDHGLVSY